MISVCLATYNGEKYILQQINSILCQLESNDELIISDDGSTDNTEEVVNSYSDPRLRFVKNEENIGQFGNFNRCIKIARGEFLHILHSDDYID